MPLKISGFNISATIVLRCRGVSKFRVADKPEEIAKFEREPLLLLNRVLHPATLTN